MPLLTVRELNRQMHGFTAIYSTATIVLIVSYLYALFRLSEAEWVGFAQIVAGLFPVLFAGTVILNRRLLADLVVCLRAEEDGHSRDIDFERALDVVVRLPTLLFASGLFWWSLGGALVAAGMSWRFDTFGIYNAAVLTMAGATGGFISSVFMFFGAKRLFTSLRSELGLRASSRRERSAAIAYTSVRRKLVVSVTGVTILTVNFALLLAFEDTRRPLEAHALRIQELFLDARLDEIKSGGVGALTRIVQEARGLGIASDLVVLNPVTGLSVFGPADLLLEGERVAIRRDPIRGASGQIDSENVFAWRALSSQQAVVIVQPWNEVFGVSNSIWSRTIGVLIAAALLSVLFARYLARDIGEATAQLGMDAARVAAGDLRATVVMESEDELGVLSRAFEEMARDLGATVRQLRKTADRVEGSAAETAGAAESMSRASTEQSAIVTETARSIVAVSQQASDIEGSAHRFGLVIDGVKGTVFELGASASQLAGTASSLFEKVDEVSGSLQKNHDGISAIGDNAGALAKTAEDATASMQEIASAMREVDTAAAQSAELSRRVVRTADEGRETVKRSVESMQTLSRVIQNADRVIRILDTRASEIGSIIHVIDDVADETSLLALNAAIIAAQAGENGSAFGVVANQVKQLAARVRTSTAEIAERIHAVQEGSAEAIEAIAEGSRAVDSGVALSSRADEALEEITEAARSSGERIDGGVRAIEEQTQAAAYVAEQMERVKERVDAIRMAADDQRRGNAIILESASAVREIAEQVRSTTSEQSSACSRIGIDLEGVLESSEEILKALQLQSTGCAEIESVANRLASRSSDNKELADRLSRVANELLSFASELRRDVENFQV